MERSRYAIWFTALVCALVVVVGCGGGGSGDADAANEAEWAWLTEAKQNLDAKRQELADLRSQAAAVVEETEEAAVEAAEEAVEDAAAETVDLAAQVEALEQEVATMSEEFTNRLVAFLNADPMLEGEEPTERQRAALRMKSDEDMILAQEWIDKGGDYKRAIEIYNTALMFDPENQKLQQALADAEGQRYMTTERFEQVKKGMNEAEVRSLLGQVNLHNVREYPDREVVAWFYPTAEDGSAAAVWFQPDKKSGEMQVYQSKFEAVKPRGEGEEEAPGAEG